MQKNIVTIFLVIVAVSLFSINVLTVDGQSKEELCQDAADACEAARQSDTSGVPADLVSQLWEICEAARQACEDNHTPTPTYDSDEDGISDDYDDCITQAEIYNDYEDFDGCPDVAPTLDSDLDGIPNQLDECPEAKEDNNGRDDEDGCPDKVLLLDVEPTDSDFDGIPNDDDWCVDEPENINGFEDDDGCRDMKPLEKLVDEEQEVTDEEQEVTDEEQEVTDEEQEVTDEEQEVTDEEQDDAIIQSTVNGDDLDIGDRVSTNDHEIKIIKFSDGSSIELRENSHFIVKQDKFKKPILTLQDGFLRIKHKIQQSVDFELRKHFPSQFRTPLAQGSIRGTDFTMSHDPTTNITSINLFEGKIALTPTITHGWIHDTIHDYTLSYIIDNGKVLNIDSDTSSLSLIVEIESEDDGSLWIVLPRELIDVRINDVDDVFFVLVDGEQIEFSDFPTLNLHTLTIPFKSGNSQIEIIGTSLDPTFINLDNILTIPEPIVEYDAPQTLTIDDAGVVSVTTLSQDTWDELTSLPQTSTENKPTDNGGGCLIATATYGSELAPQVQQLRELRDNSLLQTASGTSFMSSFNNFYYSFSPAIADYERENPLFKEAVKITLTPLISSLSILNYVDIDSEESVLGYGISLILLNVGMYVVAPAMLFFSIKKQKK